MRIIPKAEIDKNQQALIANAIAALTVADYDNAMEAYLKSVRDARGYTLREPSAFDKSTNARWKQDAEDWSAFRDSVLEYGLGILNQYAATGVAPLSLDAFKDALNNMKITWTYQEAQ